MTKKQAIIKYFTELNADMLNEILDHNQTFQEASKATFIQKLDKLFTTLKQNGDTHFTTTTGVCNEKECNFNCSGISFKSNKTGKALDLIFEETETDYTDIYYCHKFKTTLPETPYQDKIVLNILEDEKIDFKPSETYLLLQNKCDKAYNNFIAQYQNTTLSLSDVTTWLRANRELHERLPSMAFLKAGYRPFYDLHNSLSLILQNESINRRAKTALQAYKSIPYLLPFKKNAWHKTNKKLIDDCMYYSMLHVEEEVNPQTTLINILAHENINYLAQPLPYIFIIANIGIHKQ